jgi:N,N'-diacetyllegionaminate synthase
MKKVFIIAEAGVNHNGSLVIAKKLITAAAKAGVDAVKFQTFKSELLVSRLAPKAVYQKKDGSKETQLEMIKKLELDLDAHRQLIKHCKSQGLMFISSPFDLRSIDLLAKLGLGTIKIPSGEINNLPYLRKIGALKKRIILSTGMSDFREIKKALEILVKAGTKKENITVLHCNTEYPTPMKDVNLMAMLGIKDKLGVAVGYSDHTLGVEIAVAAVAMGASIIEKHLTLDRHMRGPDHQASLEPDELGKMVKMIRNVEAALGRSEKRPTDSEKNNLRIVRKSIVAARAIKKGERFNKDNITVKRPGFGLSPMLWDVVIGRQAKRDFKEDDLIKI